MRGNLPKLTRIVIMLPVLAVPLAASPAGAETVAAEQAVRLLARAKAADDKCQYLSAGLREELSGYLAKAEIAVARRSSPAEASTAIKVGRADGRSAPCNAATKADINDTLAAAREAIAEQDEPAATNPTAKKPAGGAAVEPPGEAGVSVPVYARLVRSYYVERRCRHLPKSDQRRFWKSIVSLHQSALARNSGQAVAKAMRSAERQAKGVACNDASLALVEEGFAEIVKR